MAASRPTSAPLDWLTQLAEEPYAFNFFQAVRRIEASYPDRPRVGTSLLPSQEAIRFGQKPSLAFTPAPVTDFQLSHGGEPPHRMDVAFMGLFGSNGELPHAFTRFALEQIARRRQGESGGLAPALPAKGGAPLPPGGSGEPFTDFVDMFHHRVVSAFYRAWARSRPAVARDRPDDDWFAHALAALLGIGEVDLGPEVPLDFKLFYAGQLGLSTRRADALEAMVEGLLGVACEVEHLVGEWLDIPEECAWLLGAPTLSTPHPLGVLGESAVVGPQVYERQYRFRLVVGPVGRRQFLRLLEGGEDLLRLAVLVRSYVADELAWDLLVKVEPDTIVPMQLGVVGSLGVTSHLVGNQEGAAEVYRVTPPEL